MCMPNNLFLGEIIHKIQTIQIQFVQTIQHNWRIAWREVAKSFHNSSKPNMLAVVYIKWNKSTVTIHSYFLQHKTMIAHSMDQWTTQIQQGTRVNLLGKKTISSNSMCVFLPFRFVLYIKLCNMHIAFICWANICCLNILARKFFNIVCFTCTFWLII